MAHKSDIWTNCCIASEMLAKFEIFSAVIIARTIISCNSFAVYFKFLSTILVRYCIQQSDAFLIYRHKRNYSGKQLFQTFDFFIYAAIVKVEIDVSKYEFTL